MTLVLAFRQSFENCSVTMVMLYLYRWDTGEVERMSPWDLQPVTERGTYKSNFFSDFKGKA